MRRFRRPAVTVCKRRVILFRLFLAFCAAFAVFSVLDNRLQSGESPRWRSTSAGVVSVLAMNEAVMEEFDMRCRILDRALVEVDKAPDGTVSATEIDVRSSKRRENAADRRREPAPVRPKTGCAHPAGHASGLADDGGARAGHPAAGGAGILRAEHDRGAHWRRRRINQTQHRIFRIRFAVEMSAILPGYSTSVTVENRSVHRPER